MFVPEGESERQLDFSLQQLVFLHKVVDALRYVVEQLEEKQESVWNSPARRGGGWVFGGWSLVQYSEGR